MRRVPAKINAELFFNAKKVKIFNTELSHKKRSRDRSAGNVSLQRRRYRKVAPFFICGGDARQRATMRPNPQAYRTPTARERSES